MTPCPVYSNVKPARWQALCAEERRAELMQSALLSQPGRSAGLDCAACCAQRPQAPQVVTHQQRCVLWPRSSIHWNRWWSSLLQKGFFLFLSPLEVRYGSHGELSEWQKFTKRRLGLRTSAGCCAAQLSACRDAADHSVSHLEIRGMLWPLFPCSCRVRYIVVLMKLLRCWLPFEVT